MGACASRPKDLNAEEAPLPVEKVEEQQIVPQENNTEAEAEAEAKNDEPLVDVSTPAPETAKPEEEDSAEPITEAKPEAEAANDEENKVAADEVSKVSDEETQSAPILL